MFKMMMDGLLYLKHVNIKNKKGLTCLSEACYSNDIEITKLLLKHPKIDVNIHYTDGRPLLEVACDYWYLDIIKLLLKYSKTKIDFDIIRYKDNVYIYLLLKKQINNLSKVNQILDTIKE